MSSIRLSGSTSGHYDLTVPAAAGTNSIDLSNLVVDNVAASLTGPLTVSGSQSQAGLKLNSGDTNTATGGASQIDFGFNGGANYRHNIATRHDSAGIRNNRIDMFVWQNSQNIADNGNRHVASFDGAGVTFPNQPGFSVYTTASSSLSSIIQFGGVTFNTGNHFNTSNGVFTAPQAGNYWFFYHLLTDRTTGTGEGYIDYYKNNSYHARNYVTKGTAGNEHVEYNCGIFVNLAVNDTIHLYFQATVSNTSILSNFHHCKFGGFLLG